MRRRVLLAALAGTTAAVAACSGEKRPSRVANVRRFGARGKGTDDSHAFRRAVRYASARDVSVYVPAGRYLLREAGRTLTCLDLPSGVTLMGDGVLAFDSGARTSCKLIRVAAADVTVQGVTLDLSTAPSGTSFGIVVGPGAERVTIREVTIRDNPHRGGIQVTGGRGITIRKCNILNMRQNGITLYGRGAGQGPRRVILEGCRVVADVQPVDSEPVDGAICRDVTVSDCVLVSTAGNYALTLSGSRGALVSDNILRGALYLTRAESADVRRNVIDATASPSLNAVQATFAATDCVLDGNRIFAAPFRTGVWVSRAGDESPEGWLIRNNRIRVSHTAASGIFTSDVHSLAIRDNVVQGLSGGLGIVVDAPRSSISADIRGNTVTGFTTGVQARSRGTGSLSVTVHNNVVGSPADSRRAAGIAVVGDNTQPELVNNRLPTSLPGGGLRVEH